MDEDEDRLTALPGPMPRPALHSKLEEAVVSSAQSTAISQPQQRSKRRQSRVHSLMHSMPKTNGSSSEFPLQSLPINELEGQSGTFDVPKGEQQCATCTVILICWLSRETVLNIIGGGSFKRESGTHHSRTRLLP